MRVYCTGPCPTASSPTIGHTVPIMCSKIDVGSIRLSVNKFVGVLKGAINAHGSLGDLRPATAQNTRGLANFQTSLNCSHYGTTLMATLRSITLLELGLNKQQGVTTDMVCNFFNERNESVAHAHLMQWEKLLHWCFRRWGQDPPPPQQPPGGNDPPPPPYIAIAASAVFACQRHFKCSERFWQSWPCCSFESACPSLRDSIIKGIEGSV